MSSDASKMALIEGPIPEELFEEFISEMNKAQERLFMSCFRKTSQVVVRIKEWIKPSQIDVLKEMQASGTISVLLLAFVSHELDSKRSVGRPDNLDLELIIEKPIDDSSCKDESSIPIASQEVGTEQIRSSQTESCDNIESTLATSALGGQVDKLDLDSNSNKDSTQVKSVIMVPNTNQTGFPRVSRPKMLKPKKPEVGAWKVNEAKCGDKYQFKKLIPQKFQAKTDKSEKFNGASHMQVKKPSGKFQNRQQNNVHTSMPIPSLHSCMFTPWGFCYGIPYSYSPWHSGMSLPPMYFYPGSNSYGRRTIEKSSPIHNDRFHPKNRSMDKVKPRVIKQVWRIKKDWNLEKNSDLTLDNEKPNNHISASIIRQVAPTQVVEGKQETHSVGGRGGSHKKKKKKKKKKVKSKVIFDELLAKYTKEVEEKQRSQPNDVIKNQRSSSSTRSKVPQHKLQSSHWSLSYNASTHIPWNPYLVNYNPWFCYNPWFPCYYYQYPNWVVPRGNVHDRPLGPYQDSCY